jgi:hypothetical protein
MEQQKAPPDLNEQLNEEFVSEPLATRQKRPRQNLQDVSNTPVRASGRIRIKMTAAAEQKTPDPAATKSSKVCIVHQSSSKQKKRPKKLKTDLVSELAIDVKRPSSVLVDTSIRALLTNIAFSQLSPENQKILIESLPLVDRPTQSIENQGVDLNPSSINNEFFNRACIEWRDRLSNGEFTNEHQTKLRAEHEREKSKIDPWKAKNFEGIWGIKTNGLTVNVGAMMEKSALEMKSMVEQGDFEIPEGFISEIWKSENVCDEEFKKTESGDENWKPLTNSEFDRAVASNQSQFVDSSEEMIVSSQNSPIFGQNSIDEAPDVRSDDDTLQEDLAEADIVVNDVYSNEIVTHDEDLFNEEALSRNWSHQHEHDYLKKNEQESEIADESETINEGNESSKHVIERLEESIQDEDMLIENDESLELGNIATIIKNVSNNPRINSYDAELPHEIFSKPEEASTSSKSTYPNVLLNNFVHQQVFDSGTSRYNNSVVMKDEHSEPITFIQEMNDVEPYHGKIIGTFVALGDILEVILGLLL